MPSYNIPDPANSPTSNLARIPEPPVNMSPTFPFPITPKAGAFTLAPEVSIGNSSMIRVTPLTTWSNLPGQGREIILGYLEAQNLLITPFGFFRFQNGYDQPMTDQTALDGAYTNFQYLAGYTYFIEVTSTDNHSIQMRVISDQGGTLALSADFSDTFLFLADEVNPDPRIINFGFPTREQLRDAMYADRHFVAAENSVIQEMGPAVAGPTMWRFNNHTNWEIPGSELVWGHRMTISVNTPVGTKITTFVVDHATEYSGFKPVIHNLAPNANFEVRGMDLYTTAPLVAGITGFDCDVYDRFMKSAGGAATITVE